MTNTYFSEFITKSPKFESVLNFISKVAPTDATILLLGETGVGKDLIAKAIHRESKRAEFPFITINCAAIPDTLVESELFGYKKGAFTDAKEDKLGKIELANKGTLFLNEVGEIPYSVQAKLLRVIEEHLLERLGDTRLRPIDVRIISATNANLEENITSEKFRQDLYYRLADIKVEIPPLRERKEDIPDLIKFFIDEFNKELNKNVKGISETALTILKKYDFFGNIRELKSIIKRAVILCEKDILSLENLPIDIKIRPEADDIKGDSLTLKDWLENVPIGLPIDEGADVLYLTQNSKQGKILSLKELEKRHITEVLKLCKYNKTKTAKFLEINRTTLYSKIDEYNIEGI